MNLAQQIINGLVLARLRAGRDRLDAAARRARLVNFGHGQLYMLGAFVTWWAVTSWRAYALALPIAMVVGALLGLVMQRVMLKA